MKPTHLSSNHAWLAIAVVLWACLTLVGCGQDDSSATPDTTGSNAASPPIAELAQPPANKPKDTVISAATVVLRGQSGVTIRGRTIHADPAIELHGCENIMLIDCDLSRVVAGGCRNLRIVNCYIHDSEGEAVYLDNCVDVLVQGNRLERIKTGVLVHRSSGVRVIGNYCQDVTGPLPGGQLAQFDKVTGKGNAITNNYAINTLGKSNPEDMISLYQSHGTPDSPILINNNYLVGDPSLGSAGKSDSGSGIMLGDNGGSWQLCRNNTLISPGQVGIGVACGENIVVEKNLIVGHRSDVSNVGLYAWNQYDDQPAGQVTFRGNTVAWVNSQGDDNPYWDGGGFTRIIEEGNVFGGRGLLDQIQVPGPPSTLPQPPVPFVESAR